MRFQTKLLLLVIAGSVLIIKKAFLRLLIPHFGSGVEVTNGLTALMLISLALGQLAYSLKSPRIKTFPILIAGVLVIAALPFIAPFFIDPLLCFLGKCRGTSPALLAGGFLTVIPFTLLGMALASIIQAYNGPIALAKLLVVLSIGGLLGEVAAPLLIIVFFGVKATFVGCSGALLGTALLNISTDGPSSKESQGA